MSIMPQHSYPKRLVALWEGRSLMIGAGLILTLCIAVLFIFQPLFLQQTDLRLYDTMLTGRTSPPKTAIPVMVGIDDESLAAYGQWPWPRYRLALLVQRLRELGAEVVALDILMPEPDRTSPEIISRERERDQRPVPMDNRSDLRDANSRVLADALAGGSSILGYFFDFIGPDQGEMVKLPVLPGGIVVASSTGSEAAWPRPTGTLRSIPVLAAAARAEGFTNVQPEVDGVLRRVPLLMLYQGKHFPSLAFGAALLASPDRNIRLIAHGSDTELVWGNRHIPLDRSGNLMIDFRGGNKTFPYLSARDVLSGAPKEGSLQGKIVVVGAWARGLGDFHQVPSGQKLAGLEVHATIIDNILSGSFVSRPGWARGAELCAILLLGAMITWLFSRTGYVLALLMVVVCTGGSYLGGRELLLSTGMYVSPLLPMLAPLIVMSVLSLLKYVIEARKVTQRNCDLVEAQDAIINSMSVLVEARDEETGGHILRTRKYVETLARHLATLPDYRDLDEISIDLLAKSAPLHDIGKVGIPDRILQKPAPLTDEEYAIIKTHTLIGARALTSAINEAEHPERLYFLHCAHQMIESHHEKWDGSGYPHGLSGSDIPLAGRLMALADVYDALVCKRVYKRKFSHTEAREIILNESGCHFDPDVVAAFAAKDEEFNRISRKFADENFPD